MLGTGFYPEFKGGDTFMFSGDSSQLKNLAEDLARWARDSTTRELDTTCLLGLHWRVFLISRGSSTLSSSFIVLDLKDRIAAWLLSSEAAREFSKRVSMLGDNEAPCHAYLDGDSDSLTVIASKDEYA